MATSIPELDRGGAKWPGQGGGYTISYTFLNDWPYYFNDVQKKNFSVGGDLSGPPQLTDQQKTVIRQVFALIQTFTNITFVNVDQNNQTGQIGDIAIGLGNVAGPLNPTELGESEPIGPGAGGDIWLKWDISDAAFFRTVLHEIGHSLGLNHPSLDFPENDIPFTVMAQRSDSPLVPSTYMIYDISELQSIYGVRDNNTNDNVYSFGNGITTAQTIWDTGGTNTISADGSANKAIINLNESKFSSISNNQNYDPNDPANNIGIALGVTIQNAVGSAQNDILVGNHVSNMIRGGLGDDLIFGDELIAKSVVKTGDEIQGWVLQGATDFWYKGKYQIDGTADAGDSDTLNGEAGNDYVYGGMGDDTLSGGTGNNYIDGGPGTDTALYDFGGPSQTIAIAKGGAAPSDAVADGEAPFYTVTRGSEKDVLHSIEKLAVSGQTHLLFKDGKWVDKLEIDANANPGGGGGSGGTNGEGGGSIIDFGGSRTPIDQRTLQNLIIRARRGWP